MYYDDMLRLLLKCDRALLKKYKATLSLWKSYDDKMDMPADIDDKIYLDFECDNKEDIVRIKSRIRAVKRRMMYFKRKLPVPPDIYKDNSFHCPCCGGLLDYKQEKCSKCHKYVDWLEFTKGLDDI